MQRKPYSIRVTGSPAFTRPIDSPKDFRALRCSSRSSDRCPAQDSRGRRHSRPDAVQRRPADADPRRSIVYSFDDAQAPARYETQYRRSPPCTRSRWCWL